MEFMPNFTLHRPTDIEDAVKLRAETDGALFVAGGTDMLVNVRRGIEQPEALIDLSAIVELKSITEDGDGLHIGAGVTLDTVATDARVQRDFPAVAQGPPPSPGRPTRNTARSAAISVSTPDAYFTTSRNGGGNPTITASRNGARCAMWRRAASAVSRRFPAISPRRRWFTMPRWIWSAPAAAAA